MNQSLIIRHLGQQNFKPVWQAMRDFTDQRTDGSQDEIWLVEHPPTFTLGQRGNLTHILNAGDIPIFHTDRGGQVTYHGPGQQVAYVLIDIARKKIGVRQLVTLLEQSIINLLSEYAVKAYARLESPGVYVENKKICSIGLRIHRGRSYHGIAFNVAMDLSPFSRINPCGQVGLEMTQLSEFISEINLPLMQPFLIQHLVTMLGYSEILM